MTEERFQQIERLVEAGGRCFDPATGLFEPMGAEEDITADLEPWAFLALLGIDEDESAEYVERKTRSRDGSFRNA